MVYVIFDFIIRKMPSLATLYVIATSVIFACTFGEQLGHTENYFKGIMTFLSEQTYVFILYNMILSLAIVGYRCLVWVFFRNSMEGELVVRKHSLRKSPKSSRTR